MSTCKRSRFDGRTSRAANMPLLKSKCATCPFRDGSPYEHLRGDLAASALTSASRICHSTGSRNAINYRTGKPPALCRGARDVQLQYFAASGFIEAPTDEAWAKKWKEIQDQKNETTNHEAPVKDQVL